jgi:hypothetical protein
VPYFCRQCGFTSEDWGVGECPNDQSHLITVIEESKKKGSKEQKSITTKVESTKKTK